MKTWKVSYFYNGSLTKSVVLAKSITRAINNLRIVMGICEEDVISCKEEYKEGVILTRYQD